MSASGSLSSTVSREDNFVVSSEDSSSPDESELELGLGLSLGGGGRGFKQQATSGGGGGHYARILTAKDIPSVLSSSSSSSSLSKINHVTAGTKRSADSVAAANATSQVVGWPPIRASRINCIVNQAKSLANEEYNSMIEKNTRKNTVLEKITKSCNNGGNAKGSTSRFVKANMDGILIGRKVDLNAYSCYETLAQTLEDMFHRPTTTVNTIRSSLQEKHDIRVEATRPSKLLGGTSDFVLTYEDKDGDWMLVGDVPWGMFIFSVKRLRIMRTSEANGLAPRLQESSRRQRNKPI